MKKQKDEVFVVLAMNYDENKSGDMELVGCKVTGVLNNWRAALSCIVETKKHCWDVNVNKIALDTCTQKCKEIELDYELSIPETMSFLPEKRRKEWEQYFKNKFEQK